MKYSPEDELRIAALEILIAANDKNYGIKNAAWDFARFREKEEAVGWWVSDGLKEKIDRTYQIMIEKNVITLSEPNASGAGVPEVIPVYRSFYKELQVR